MPAPFTLSQLAHIVLLPPMSLFLAMLAGWLLRRRWPRAGTALAGGALALLVVLSTGAGARLLVRPLENMTAPLAAGAEREAQAIVVLAAGNMEQAPEYGGNSPDGIALARLRYGARLQHSTGLPLLVTGGNAEPQRGVPPKAEAMARALREDFRTEVRWIEPDSATTAENAAFSARLLQPAGVQRVLLVTDAMHMPRARRVFERAGLQVIAAPTMFRAWGPMSAGSFLPRADALESSYYAVYEWIGLAWYRIKE
ncbi:YdcF family protein [Pseudoduganella sp. UC29_71]|uniref:YdcF family protein n=1 Tax=Pseudoduganella sp. UC29_71 TaxID=3350174 RepID=UPI00366A8137